MQVISARTQLNDIVQQYTVLPLMAIVCALSHQVFSGQLYDTQMCAALVTQISNIWRNINHLYWKKSISSAC